MRYGAEMLLSVPYCPQDLPFLVAGSVNGPVLALYPLHADHNSMW